LFIISPLKGEESGDKKKFNKVKGFKVYQFGYERKGFWNKNFGESGDNIETGH
jgi:hypothetical protein